MSLKISGETSLLSLAVVLLLNSMVALTPHGQFLHCAASAFSERRYSRLDGRNNGILDSQAMNIILQ